ncbi:hypothetical protein SAMN05192562_1011253 [Kosakonia arachidis]|uniref:Uncharacterized protein n=1 Tax=Kosakonia arachidis TaxID=551989 RepID=A0A1I6ZMB0_9ENTR|nr:hypothetical protein SAMN05192562_1011253 [Kosakonia arachidis]
MDTPVIYNITVVECDIKTLPLSLSITITLIGSLPAVDDAGYWNASWYEARTAHENEPV